MRLYIIGISVPIQFFPSFLSFFLLPEKKKGKKKRNKLAVRPLVHVEHGEFVAAGVGSIIAVVGEVQAVVAVGLQVGCAVEQVILRVGGLRLHLAFAETAVDAEGG